MKSRKRASQGSDTPGSAAGAMSVRFKRLYGKPKKLTDYYDECRPEVVAKLLAKAESQWEWGDFQTLYRVGVAPASYEEGLYFVPDALVFLRRNPNGDGVHCVADVIWFLSKYSERLSQDGLLTECQERVLGLLEEHTAQFVVVHWDWEKNQQMGYKRDHYDYVENGQVVGDTLEALFRFESLASVGASFLASLSQARGEPIKSAWFLECVETAKRWALFRGATEPPAGERLCAAMPELSGVWKEFEARGMVKARPALLEPDRDLIEYHADVIRNAGELFTANPTYWGRMLRF